MPIVNFFIPKNLDDRIQETIKEKGFATKAEFFRYCAVRYIDSDKERKNNLVG